MRETSSGALRNRLGDEAQDRTIPASRFLPALSTTALREGLHEISGVSLGIVIWGIVTGVAMVRGGIPLPWAIAIGLVAYAGSAQLAVLPLVVSRGPLPIVLATATLVNLRFLIFSAAMRQEFAHLPVIKRFASGYVNGDFSFTLFQRRFDRVPLADPSRADRMGYYFGIALPNWIVWNAASTIGMVLGGGLPRSWGLELAATLALISVVIPLVTSARTVPALLRGLSRHRFRPVVVGAFTTAALSVALARLPYRLGLVVSMVVGIVVATVVDLAQAGRTDD